jgi:hypothetical protein
VAALIKAQAGSLVAALDVATLPLRDQESRRIPVIGAVHLTSNATGFFAEHMRIASPWYRRSSATEPTA